MTTSATRARLSVPIALSERELVAIVALLMALNALAIDIMLPALPAMGADLGVVDANDRQYVVTGYLVGVGVAQLGFGPLSDWLGRRGPLLGALFGYALLSVACAAAPTFELLVLARALQGVFASGTRVSSMSIVRDVYAGRGMARIMSLVMMVFMIVPIVAPNLGQGIVMVATWPWIFAVLVVISLALAGWVFLRLPETLPPERRSSVDVGALVAGYRRVLSTRTTLGYTIAVGSAYGALVAYISAAEQIFGHVFGKGTTFALYFAGVAATMAVASMVNARLVSRFGMRRMSHVALVAFVALNAGQVLLESTGHGSFLSFYLLLAAAWFFFAFLGANFNAIAMEPMGEIAGTASAFLGFASTLIATALGTLIGQQFDGTLLPIVIGFTGVGVFALLVVLVTERGKLFVEPSLSEG